MEKVFVNIGYGLMLIGITIKDILYLRIVLFCGHSFIWMYALSVHNTPVVFWNTLFIIINGVRIINLYRERRPHHIPEYLLDLYQTIFSAMGKKEFLDFWDMGKPHKINDKYILRNGEKNDDLFIVVRGEVLVSKNGRQLASLNRGRFIGDMGFLSGEIVSADVIGNGYVEYHTWSRNKLLSLEQTKPEMLLKLQNIIGKDLTVKIKNTSDGLSLT